ncbi:MAG: hypothetical protein ABUL60_27490 [Myxococcales bacterium]
MFEKEESIVKNNWVWMLPLLLGTSLVGCDPDCQEERDAMQAFLVEPSHLSCASNEDCAVVNVGCVNVSRAFCGQAALNKTAAASSSWKSLRSDADDCVGANCGQCAAALLPWCKEGFCGGLP